MIKKFITILLIIMICGCTNRISLNNELSNLGYTEEEIRLINKYKYEDTLLFYKSYNKRLLSIIADKRCEKKNMSLYLMYYREYNNDELFKLINSNYLTKDNHKFIRSLINSKYFIFDNIDKYMEYIDKFDDLSLLIGYVNTNAYKEPYVDYITSNTDDEMLVIGNKWYYLDDYEPTNLIVINKKYGLSNYEQKIKKETYDAFIKMYDAAKKDKISLYITSAYRSHDYQVKIYDGYLAKDSQEVVDTYSSRPGYSDHQTGLAVDILSYGYNFDTFESSPAFTWLKENAYKYGFILRYPKEKEEITGYMYESWHYRYVGEDLAKLMINNNLTYEEYYAYYIENKIK